MRKRPPADDALDDDAGRCRVCSAHRIGADRGKVRALPRMPRPRPPRQAAPAAKMARRDEAAAREEFRHAVVSALEADDVLSHRRESVAATGC